MRPAKGSIGRAVDSPDPKFRFYLFYGPDEAQSRALADRLVAGLGVEKRVLAAGDVRGDPAALADEAGAISLFGERQAIWIEPAGDEITAGVEALMAAPACESPVIAIAGALRKSSALVKLAEAAAGALAHASYAPEGRDAETMVAELARGEGLRLDSGVAGRIAASCDNDRRMIAQELAKLALFVDASPQTPRDLGHEALDAIGAGTGEGDLMRLADLALAGELDRLAGELSRLPGGGTDAIPIVRSLQRRVMMLAPMRARVERGEKPDAVMASAGKSVFWKDKPLVTKLLSKWSSERLATAAERAGALERQLLSPNPPPSLEALGEELTAIARAARRR